MEFRSKYDISYNNIIFSLFIFVTYLHGCHKNIKDFPKVAKIYIVNGIKNSIWSAHTDVCDIQYILRRNAKYLLLDVKALDIIKE
jgi:hypothetical protein